MTRFVRFLVRTAVGCVGLFLTVVCLTTIIQIPWAFDQHRVVFPLACGFAAGLIFFTFVSELRFLYVFGHELTHWVLAKFFLRETGSMQVCGEGGHVHVERPNMWIVLGPYFVPLYAVVWTGLYGLALLCMRTEPGWLVVTFTAGLGVTYAFHIRMTAFALSKAQTDLRMHGTFMSLSIVLLCNVALVLLCLIVATGEWQRGFTLVSRNVTEQARFVARLAMTAVRFLVQLVNH